MNSSVPLDCAFFQLSPRRTRCELFVSAEGKTEKLASGFFKPFLTHMKIAEEQASHDAHLINLEVGRRKTAATWFNKGTVERFVRFVSTPEVLELVNTLDAEMSQLEGARKMYSQGVGDQLSGESGNKSAATADATKKELLRAIDVRLLAVKQDLATACARASAAGFNLESVSELLRFADQFSASRLSEACKSFLSLPQRRPELISHQQALPSPAINPQWKSFNDTNVGSSSGSDMSIDESEVEQTDPFRGDAQLHNLSPNQQQQQVLGRTTATNIAQIKENSQHLVEKEMEKVDNPASSAVSSAKSAQQSGGSKRLTVQDRINLFESKQKDQSVNPNVGGSFGGPFVGRLAGTRGEHRRNSSDVSVEKLVLRRWSGASDMSIDLNSNSTGSFDRKESGSTAGTPTSANLQHQIISRNCENDCGLIEASKSHARLSSKNSLMENSSSTFPSSLDQDRTISKGESQPRDAVHEKFIASASVKPLGLTKGQPNTWTYRSCSLEGLEHGGLCEQVVSQSRTKGFSNSGEVISRRPAASQNNFRSDSADIANDQTVSQIPSRASLAVAVSSEPKDQATFMAQPRNHIDVDDIVVKNQHISEIKFSTLTAELEDTRSKSMSASDSQTQFKPSMVKTENIFVKGDSGHPETHGSSVNEELMARHTNLTAQVSSKVSSAKARLGSSSVGLRLPGKTARTDEKFQGRRDEKVTAEESSSKPFQSRKINEGMEASPFSPEDSQTAWPNKDNHELKDALYLKAEELEKIFAEHKLKNHSDQIPFARRRKTLGDHSTKSAEKRSAQSPPKQKPEKSLLRQDSSSGLEFDPDLLPGMIEKLDLCDIKMQKIGNHSPIDVPRGKLYGKYMQRRDVKLSQEGVSKRAQKEAKMKAMHDSLELSQAEMKARFAAFSDGRNLTDARRRAEKMRSFNARSTLKVKDQFCKQTSESLTRSGDVDEQELSESPIGNQSNKLLSSTTSTSVRHTPKHMVKSSNSNFLRHRGQTENPVAQSVPTFSDLKNENTQPLAGAVVAKAAVRGQPRSFARSKSSNEDAEISKEDRSSWSNTMKKNSVTSSELKDLCSLNSEKALHNIQMSGEFKQHLKKGNGITHESGAVLGKSRSFITSEELKNKEKSEETVNQKEDLQDLAVDDEEFENAYAEGNNNMIMDGEPESENGELMGHLSHLDDSTISFSKFNSAGNAEDSAEESSGSLNSHIYHSLAYTREASDIYASSDFTTDCTSWNCHSVNQMMDSEAARMRKKWGSAQLPVISTSASQQSRRDVTKGFKRLLKFGRKSRGSDYLVNDWFSASTASEGDDDPDDGRDLVHRPSDDFRKSRMGCSTTYDGFNDRDVFPEQAQPLGNSIPNPPTNFRLRDDHHLSGSSLKAPRSFFSLSSFRSKAGDSKPR